MADRPSPHIAAALLCEVILQEKDELISLIRLVDQITISPAPQPGVPLPVLSPQSLIGLRPGDAEGRHDLELRVNDPSGQVVSKTPVVPAHFVGPDRGVNLITAVPVPVTSEGLYWVDVVLDGDVITRMPLRVVFAAPSESSTPALESPQ